MGMGLHIVGQEWYFIGWRLLCRRMGEWVVSELVSCENVKSGV